MRYVVFEVNNKQYLSYEGEELLLDHYGSDKIDSKILLTSIDGDLKLGNPYLLNIKLSFDIIREEKGEKITVIKYKAKSRYRKKIGVRPFYTRVKLIKIIS